MRITRTTSVKSKFKNTQETILNLDKDDDDFVAPPTDNISTQPTEGVGSEPNDTNIVGSSKTKKQRKTTSRSEHGKNNVDSGKSDVNKDKEDIIPINSTSVGRLKRKGSARNTPVKDNKKSLEASGKGKNQEV
ncbi:unnamed protein product [Lactuca saligna]|uniref:Uncharacterized protein n=1 Tax=Lactuca saligna TaxID=75948 RepID=A0AA35Z6G2_LACSI|nr:unnamed protein product [Lactuca saligna]